MEKTETPVIELKKVPTIEAEALRKRSEVLAEHEDIQKKNEELLKEMQEREYVVDFKSKAVFTRLYKFLEKDARWGHTTAAGLIMLHNNLKQEKVKVKTEDWDKLIKLRAINVTTLWTMMTKMEGSGFHEAKNFVELMASIGQSISEAVRQVHMDNQELRDNHEALTKLDHLLDHGPLEEDCKSKNDSVSSNGEEGNA